MCINKTENKQKEDQFPISLSLSAFTDNHHNGFKFSRRMMTSFVDDDVKDDDDDDDDDPDQMNALAKMRLSADNGQPQRLVGFVCQ